MMKRIHIVMDSLFSIRGDENSNELLFFFWIRLPIVNKIYNIFYPHIEKCVQEGGELKINRYKEV